MKPLEFITLGNRYRDDDKSILNLNSLQRENVTQFKEKLAHGEYVTEEVTCPVCDGNSFSTLAAKDRYGIGCDFVACQNCGLVQTNPRMDQTSYNKFYNSEYRPIYIGERSPTEKFFKQQYFSIGAKIYNFIKRRAKIDSHENLLVFEVGCGAGGILKYFADKGFRVKGIDIGREYLEYGKVNYGLDLSVDTLETVSLNEQPDIIIYSHVLEHILDLRGQISLIKSIMKPSTILYIEVPGLKNLHRSYEGDLLLYLQNAHVYHFTKNSLSNLLVLNGFRVIAINQFVRSIFQLQHGLHGTSIQNEYRSIVRYLKWIEMIRKLSPIPPYQVPYFIKRFGYQLLALIGIVPKLHENKKWHHHF